MTARGGKLLLLLLSLAAGASQASAQRWMADVYAGGIRYDALARHTAAANIVGNVRYQTLRLSAYLSAAAPIDRDAPVWGAFGARTRRSQSIGSRSMFTLDAAGDAYAFRTDGTSGSGFSTHVLPTLAVSVYDVLFELQGGRHDHVFRTESDDRHRHVYELGVRATVGSAERHAILALRTLEHGLGSYPMARLQLGAAFGSARVWAAAGRWFGDDITENVWDAGVSLAVGARGEVWAAARRDAADPLYLSPTRTTWNVGYSIRLGAAPATPRYAPVVRTGSLVLRLPRDSDAPPSVAGEFNEWQPVPMQASGDEWRIEIPVRPGAYRFAFVSPSGEWFVPEGYPGRMSDDMGGHIALVIVP